MSNSSYPSRSSSVTRNHASIANTTPREATFALWMMFLLGKPATFGHDPPTILRSTRAVRWPSFDNVRARYLPASPLPMTRRSYCSVVVIEIILYTHGVSWSELEYVTAPAGERNALDGGALRSLSGL